MAISKKKKRSMGNNNSDSKLLRRMFDYLTDFIVLCDENFKIVESNRSADVILGSGDSVVGSFCFETFRTRDSVCTDCPLGATIESGSIIPVEMYDERFDEYFEERTHPVLDKDDKLEGFVLVGRNVTKARELEEKYAQAKKLAALGQISSGVAHDFNNVLTGVLGRVQLMRRQIKDPEIIKNLQMIQTAALDGAATVRRMQDFARSKREEMFISIDIKELLEEVVALTRPKWKDAPELRGILIEPVLELSDDLFIMGDPSDLRGAFTNLIFNAIDAMPDGGILTVRSTLESNRVKVKFIDTGIGMTEETVAMVFDPFFSTKGVKGTGLGMSEVYGVIKRHSGVIDMESHVGKGTSINLSFPIAGVDKTKTTDTESVEVIPARILVIDDEPYILQILKELLTEFGHEVVETGSAERALQLFSNSDFDIVITDLGMPDMSGWEVAEKIKEINASTPIIMLTGWSIDLNTDKHRQNSVDYVMHKPFSVEEIVRVISDAKKMSDNKSK